MMGSAYRIGIAGIVAASLAGALHRDTPILNKALEACVLDASQPTTRIGTRDYARVKEGASGKSVYFFPNIHTKELLARDEDNIAELVYATLGTGRGKVDSVVMEGLPKGGPYTMITVPLLSKELSRASLFHGVAYFGTSDNSTYEKAVQTIAALLKDETIKQFEKFYDTLSGDKTGLNAQFTLNGFSQKFGSIISKYRTEVSGYENQNPNFREEAKGDMFASAKEPREREAMEVVDQVLQTGGSVAIQWGRGHTEAFIHYLCNSGHSIYIADTKEPKAGSPELDTKNMKVDGRLKEVFEVQKKMQKYIRGYVAELEAKVVSRSIK